MLYELRIYDAVAGPLARHQRSVRQSYLHPVPQARCEIPRLLDRRNRPEQSAHLYQRL